jgi:hypothetical protein
MESLYHLNKMQKLMPVEHSLSCFKVYIKLRKVKEVKFIAYVQLSWYSDGLWPGQTGFNSQQGQEIFVTPQHPDCLWGPRSLLSNVCWGPFPLGVKQLVREADHSPPANAEVKKMWIIHPLFHTPSWRSA